MSSRFEDRLKILDTESAKVENIYTRAENYFKSLFKDKVQVAFSKAGAVGAAINFVKDVSNLMFFQVEDAVTENNRFTAQKEISLRHMTDMSGYNAVREISSRGSVSVKLLSGASSQFGTNIIIRKYAILTTEYNDLTYLVDISSDHLTVNTSISGFTLPLIEGKVKSQQFVSTGKKMYTIGLDDTLPIEHYDIKVKVDGELWEKGDSLLSLVKDQKSYILRTGFFNQVDIIFGDGICGKIPEDGSTIIIEYITTSGAEGNINRNDFPAFKFISGVFNTSGENIDIKDFVSITKESGFLLGSNGDSIERLRAIVGMNDRAYVLAKAQNISAYLNRLSCLSRVSSWVNENEPKVKYILALPNINIDLLTYNEYLNIDESKFTLSQEHKGAIISMIESSRRSFVSDELVFVDSVVQKYSMLVYLSTNKSVTDKTKLRERVVETIATKFMSETFKDSSYNSVIEIPKSILLHELHSTLEDDFAINLVIISRQNEEAKINGYYDTYQEVYAEGVTKRIPVRVSVAIGDDPKLGLTEHNDIKCNEITDVPLLRAGFDVMSSDGTKVNLGKPVTVYLGINGKWEQL